MYVVKYQNMIVLGIIPWNNKYIQDVFRVRYRVNIEIPYDEPASESFPFIVNDDIIIYPAEEDRPPITNVLTQMYYGPTWEFLENKVIAHYEVVYYSLEDAKIKHREVAAGLRYKKEISGFNLEIGGVERFFSTNRDDRTKYSDRLLVMNDDEIINWKFNNGDWVNLNKQQMLSIVQAIHNHVQSAFNYELELNNAINSAQSIDDLLAIEDIYKKPDGNTE
ncbi:DUF4376 domain-containing protein [bacterium]|nr:DUF4376 domain-containing protein [Candidatus Elulimicrobium humile]